MDEILQDEKFARDRITELHELDDTDLEKVSQFIDWIKK